MYGQSGGGGPQGPAPARTPSPSDMADRRSTVRAGRSRGPQARGTTSRALVMAVLAVAGGLGLGPGLAWAWPGTAAATAAGAPLGRDPAEARRGACPRKVIEKEAKGGLLEYSVIYTDRATNSMSTTFQKTMNDLHAILTETYAAHRAVIIPGSGTYGMEAVARQIAVGKKVMVIRNGYFSYRWTDIFQQGDIPESHSVHKAAPANPDKPKELPQYRPMPIAEVLEKIRDEKPDVVFAPHVETSLGLVLPDEYVEAVGRAAREAGALFVLDGIAAGMQWQDMQKGSVDFYLTAPQKGWTAPASAGVVLMSQRGYAAMKGTKSNSMVLNLSKWNDIMEAYLNGGFGYHATMPTDALGLFRDAALETKTYGLAKAKEGFLRLGRETRAMLEGLGFTSVSAPGFQAPGVVVSYTDDPKMVAKLKALGIQVAAGVPFMLDERKGLVTFRVGLFGIDKVYDIPRTVGRLKEALEQIKRDAEEGEL